MQTILRARRLTAALAAAAAVAVAALAAGAAPASATTSRAVAATTSGIVPVASVDIARYLGSWRQIADIPQWYEALCLKDVTATYSLNPNGTVKVLNTCTGPLGVTIRTDGTARILDRTSNAQLQVSFLSFFGTPLYPDSTPNYVIIGLASDYSWAVVGSPNRATAYVLSRTPTLTAQQTSAVVAALQRSGYDPCALTLSPQTGGASKAVKAC